MIFLVLLILVFPSFVFFGVQSYSDFMSSSHDAAKVDGKVTSVDEVDARVCEQAERLHQMLGVQYDSRQLESPQMRRDVPGGIIRQHVPANEVTRVNLTVSNEKTRNTIFRILAVATLHKPDGSFDQEAYVRLLSAQNMTPEQLEGNPHSELSRQQTPRSIVSSAFVSKSPVDRLIQIRDQQYEARVLLFRPTDHTAEINAGDRAIQAYYDAHQQEFSVPEQVKAKYVVFSGEGVIKQTPVTPGQLKEYHDQSATRFKTQKERCTAYILIKLPSNAKLAGKEAAKEKTEEVPAEVCKNLASFADLARECSSDPDSVAQGGELGFFGKGTTVPLFGNALFVLKQLSDISDMVQSDFGFHIIKLEEVKGGGAQPLGVVKPELERELRTQFANKKYSELAGAFSNMVGDQSDGLKLAADEFKLQIQTADNVTHMSSPTQSGSPVGNDEVLKALSADDTIRNHRNTAAIQVGSTTLAVACMVEYRPATAKKLADVCEQVKIKVIVEQAAALTRKAGEEKLAAVKQSNDTDGFGTVQTVLRQQAQGTPSVTLATILRADVTKLPTTIGVDLSAQGYALYCINKVLPPVNVGETRHIADAQQLARAADQTELNAYYEALKARSKVKISDSTVDNSRPTNTAED